MDKFKENRALMKSNFRLLQQIQSDQDLKLPQPPLEKSYEEGSTIIELPKVNSNILTETNIYTCIKKRRSNRKFTSDQLSLAELSFLLWATQGVQRVFGKNNFATYRPVPSGGARHPFETYLAINNVSEITPGVYRYLPLTHRLVHLFSKDYNHLKMGELALDQKFVGESAVAFIWSCLPYRSEWRYNVAAHKTMLIDAGHLCQNLYLACGAIGCGTCAIGAYNQEAMDKFLGLDGEDEFVVYMAPVGKV
jgi:SagB-type dehydrogenase family enzyme